MKTPTKQSPRYLWQKIAIAIIGLILSIVFHELFHVALHWGEITSITFFRNGSITEMTVIEHTDEDIEGEEVAAYLITLLVMMGTVMAIYRINDSTDERTVSQILFPGHLGLRRMLPSEFMRLAGKTELLSQSNMPPRKTRKK